MEPVVGEMYLYDEVTIIVTKVTEHTVFYVGGSLDTPVKRMAKTTFDAKAKVLEDTPTTGAVTGRWSDSGLNMVESIDPKFFRHPLGPWEEEPNAKVFMVGGLKGLILRNPLTGALCGYVRIPRGKLTRRLKKHGRIPKKPLKPFGEMDAALFRSSLFSKLRRKVMYDHPVVRGLEVHGGLTFSGKPQHLKAKRGLWLGFDCAHCDDLMPYMLYFGVIPPGEYRTMEYVEDQVRELAKQVKALHEGNGW